MNGKWDVNCNVEGHAKQKILLFRSCGVFFFKCFFLGWCGGRILGVMPRRWLYSREQIAALCVKLPQKISALLSISQACGLGWVQGIGMLLGDHITPREGQVEWSGDGKLASC